MLSGNSEQGFRHQAVFGGDCCEALVFLEEDANQENLNWLREWQLTARTCPAMSQ
jgi:hypothetical protein